MKGIITVVCAVTLLLISCRDRVQKQSNEIKKDSTPVVKDFLTTLDSGKRGSGVEVLHTGNWMLNYFVDDFGDKTNKAYLQSYSFGTFDNSATNEATLYVKLIVEKADAGIFLHEYGMSSPPVKIIGKAKMRMKNPKGETLDLAIFKEWNHSGGLLVNNYIDKEFSKFKNFIFNSTGVVKVVIRDEYSSTYRFDIDPGDLKEKYKTL